MSSTRTSPVPDGDDSAVSPVERYEVEGDRLCRITRRRSGAESVLWFDEVENPSSEVDDAEAAWLRLKAPPAGHSTNRSIRAVDLFSGCGGLSLGASEAAASLGLGFELALAVDINANALAILEKNFLGVRSENVDVTSLFGGATDSSLTSDEKRLRKRTGQVDLLLGGPPCQGHSDLNNRTRRLDPKNELYFSMVRAAQVLEPSSIVIENVPGALNDRGQVVQRSVEALQELGYAVDVGVVAATRIGVPQRRRRLLVLASKTEQPTVAALESDYRRPSRGVGWAIGDLVGAPPFSIFDESANSNHATRERIDYLFDRGLFNLPDSQRPPCHRDGNHSYASIYGRLSLDEPSQTITRGFYSMCMGRYVHPTERRTLTAHEAARLQSFPDFFDFSGATKRTQLADVIGNAVPSRLGQVAVLELLR